MAQGMPGTGHLGRGRGLVMGGLKAHALSGMSQGLHLLSRANGRITEVNDLTAVVPRSPPCSDQGHRGEPMPPAPAEDEALNSREPHSSILSAAALQFPGCIGSEFARPRPSPERLRGQGRGP